MMMMMPICHGLPSVDVNCRKRWKGSFVARQVGRKRAILNYWMKLPSCILVGAPLAESNDDNIL
jgi:hypothetical protein